MIVVLVAMFLNLMTVMALELGAPYRSLPISTNDVWTPTCIAGSPSEDASFIGGFRTLFKNDTSYLTIMKRSTVDEPPLWTRTIFSAYGRKNLALGCTTDSSGDVYVTTASNAPWFDGIKNTLFDTGAYSLFITKLDGNANGKTIWTRALNRTSAGFDDALEVAWDSLNNAIVIFGQMHVIGGQLVSGNQAQVIRLDAVCGNLISNDIIGSRDTTMARRLLVNDNGEAFFIGSASSFFNSWYPMCSPTPCMSCFISKYNSTGGHEWTVGASVRSDCLGVTVALDRVSTHLVVYADVRDSQVARSTMLRRINTITGARSNPVYYGSASTSIGAVFTHAGKILISGVTSEDFTNANQKRPCSTCTFSFFAQLNTSASTTTPFEIIDVQYWPRAVNTGITESRHSGMAWSTVTSKVTCLTTTTLDSLVDRSVLMVVNGMCAIVYLIVAPNCINSIVSRIAPTYPSLSTIPKLPIYQQTCPMNIPVITSTAPTATTTRTTSAVKTTSIITLISSTRGMTYSQSTKTTSATATGTTSTLSGLVSTTPTQPSGLPNDGDLTLLDSPIFWAVFALIICSGILISIGIVLARRNNRQNYSEDKEQQFQLGTRTLSASTNALLQSNNDLSTKSFTDIQLVAFPRDQVKIQDRLNTVVLFSQPANAAQNIIQAAEPTSVLLSQHDLAPPVYISQKLVSKPPPAAFAVVTRGTRNGDASRRNVTNSNERLDMHSVNSSNKIGNNSTAKTETLAEEPIQKAGIHELSKGSSVRFNGFQAKPVPSARKIDLDGMVTGENWVTLA